MRQGGIPTLKPARLLAVGALLLTLPGLWAQGRKQMAVSAVGASGELAEIAVSNRVLDLTNEKRTQYGLPPLRISPKLCEVARWMAKDMAQHGYFGHIDRFGRDVSQRADSAGYSWSIIGENLAAGQHGADEVVQDWMSSAGHRKNLLRRDYREIGIAYVDLPTSEYKTYWVQVYAVPQK